MSAKTIIYVRKPSDIPTVDHFVIVEARTIEVPGDERSRTSPGHGYPSHTEEYLEYVAYLKREEWEEAIRVLHAAHVRKAYKALIVKCAVVTTSVTVS